ncbi:MULTISPECIES: SIR2 family NAD-dependent protein deacylase [Lysobacter]|uniref:NAD-dependent protein deacylase n=1 Tax=Lysobacter yananisis TaxID=1003114 RepID=A0ABY9PG62_9GAMM|nr:MULTISPECIES: Sir2 family NAD-dependent protein deacetylase [Lysobacter]QQQ02239.1 NAD-dependent deacylase [Lysobacter enzymogenes]WMT05379.1 Sir2 family NAD-dependent protein deacetylase [Lysobacter yananisis]
MKPKIVVFTGAGVSAESGLKTFRDMGGLWHEHRLEDVASPEGWRRDPATVLRFYNERRLGVLAAQPNAAHAAIARLEEKYDVVVITQNIDDLHERAGSSQVLHVHGEILKARSSADQSRVYPMTGALIEIGDLCELGSQLRPDVVWFGENVRHLRESARHFAQADKVLAIGTSLTVWPAAGLVDHARDRAERVFVSPEQQEIPDHYRFLRGTAVEKVPPLVEAWLAQA